MKEHEVLSAEQVFEFSPGTTLDQCSQWIKKIVPGKENSFLLRIETNSKKRLEIYKREGDDIPHHPFVFIENDKPHFHSSINTAEALHIAFQYLKDFNGNLPKDKSIPVPRIENSLKYSSGYSGF